MNIEVLPLIFDIDREVYRKGLITMVTQTTTTALGVLLGLLLFRALGWSPQKPGRDEIQEYVSVQGNE